MQPTLEEPSAPVDWRGTDRYAVSRYIGSGAMGAVYEAFDEERQKPVALKALLRFSPTALYLFKQEFRALADVHHPNLVQLYELVATHSERVFFVMELVHGTDFLAHVRKPGALSTDFDKLRRALRQLAEGVEALHSAGKLHRDIKPSNVLCTREGRVVLLDFGVATELPRVVDESLLEEDCFVGSAQYMAPEQALAEPATPASDWYSLGVMLYEALIGEPPFAGTAFAVLSQKSTVDPRAPSELVPGVPADLDELCQALLNRDPKSRPRGREILRRLETTRSTRAVLSVVPAPANAAEAHTLVGRESHVRALRDAFAASCTGRSITMRVGGRAGSGKSSIVQHFVDELIRGGEAVVLRGRAYEREAVPYKAVDGVVDSLSRHLLRLVERDGALELPEDIGALARLFPVLRRVPAIDHVEPAPEVDPLRARRRACAALCELLRTLAHRQPLVLYIDDVQWGDTDSAALLLQLVSPPDAPPLLLIMTHRDEEANAPLLVEMQAHWPEGAESRDLAVGPLDDLDSQQLALALLASEDATPHRPSASFARESGGNPFLIEELARYVKGQHRMGLDTSARGATLTLQEMVDERLALLPNDARRLLEIVALGGRPLPIAMVGEASGVHEADSIIQLLCARRFVRSGLRDGHEVVETVHDRIRETIVFQLSAPASREYHERLALALERAKSADVEALATHWLGAGENRRAATYAERAAEVAASKLALDHAARLLRLALASVPAASPDTRRLRRRLAEVLEWAGSGREAAPIYLEAAEGAPALERIDLERAAAEQLLASGGIDQATAVLRRVLDSLGMTAPRSPLGVLFWLAFYGLWARVIGLKFENHGAQEVRHEDRVRLDALYAISLGFSVIDPLFAQCMKERHLIEALRVGDSVQVSRAAALCAINGRPEAKRVRALADLADRLAERSQNAGAIAYSRATKGVHLYLSGEWKRALCALDDAYARLPTVRAGWQSNANFFAINCLCFTGELREAKRRLGRLLVDAEQRGDLFLSVNLGAGYTAMVWLAADDPQTARRRASEAMARWTRRGFLLQHWYVMLAEADSDLYVGDGASAYERVDREAGALKKSLLLRLQTVRAMTLFLRGRCAIASIQADPAKRAARLAEARLMARRLGREKMPWTAALAAMVGAAAANAIGKHVRAAALLRVAIELAETADMPLYAASARHRLGTLLRGEEGRELVLGAEDAMTARGVRAPTRFAAWLVPGRWETSETET